MYYPSETQISPLTNVRRERILPVPGDVLVRLGDRVEPTQVVAQANMPGEFRVLAVAHLLDVAPSRIKRFLRVKVGEELREGHVIATRGFLNTRSVKSPIDGVLAASGSGRVLIQAPPTPFELRAYVYGSVVNVLEERGVVIETTGALIQGTWGAGDESFGVLKSLVKGPDKPLRARDIDPSCHGTIIIGGSGLDEVVLERAEELQVRGIVTGGLAPEMISHLDHVPFPIVVTEGIGVIPMAEPIFRLLTTNDGREASISGHVRSRWGVIRPEVVIPLPAEAVSPSQALPGSPLTVGTRVRVIRAPHLGKVGTVAKLDDRPRRVETEARVRGAELDLGIESPVFVPLANLEVLR